MAIDIAALPDDVAQLKKLVVEQSQRDDQHLSLIRKLEEEKQKLERAANELTEKLELLRFKLFGRRTEKLGEEERLQMSLFDESEIAAQSLEEKPEESEMIPVRPHSRRKAKRRPLPERLPREEVIHDIGEEEKVCSCGKELSRIGEETSEKLDIIPAQIKVIRHVRLKYACKSCEGEKAVKIAPVPPQIIPKGIATAGLLAYILTSKFVDALPFYRQEKQFSRIGIDIPRSTMGDWAIQAARKCEPLLKLMHEAVLSGPMIQMDETTVQVMKERGRANGTKSYMWVVRGGDPEHPILLYQYFRTRSGDVPLAYLENFKGYLQTDGYAGYDEVGKLPGITHVGCWAHVRRLFFEAKKATKKSGSADEALARIGKLYIIERQLRDAGLSEGEFVEKRKEKVDPILEKLKGWLQQKASQSLPSSLLGKAVNYALNQWDKLERYTDLASMTPDTNLVLCSGYHNPQDSGKSFVDRANHGFAA